MKKGNNEFFDHKTTPARNFDIRTSGLQLYKLKFFRAKSKVGLPNGKIVTINYNKLQL